MSGFMLYSAFAFGGGLGAAARHAISRAIDHSFPWATLIVNVLGSLVLGWAVASFGTTEAVSPAHQNAIFGFCGGFTTFSSFAYQTLNLNRNEGLRHAGANIALNLALCIAAFAAGLVLA